MNRQIQLIVVLLLTLLLGCGTNELETNAGSTPDAHRDANTDESSESDAGVYHDADEVAEPDTLTSDGDDVSETTGHDASNDDPDDVGENGQEDVQPPQEEDTGDEEPEPVEPEWATNDLTALYTFDEGAGDIVHDVSGLEPALDLVIQSEAAAQWSDAGLTFPTANMAQSVAGANKVNQAITSTGEITIDAWITPATANQDGPARIVTSSVSTSARNFTLGQHGSELHGRLRTTDVGDNGHPGAQSPPGVIGEDTVHAVYTRDNSGQATLYIDGEPVHNELISGDLSSWDINYHLALGSEVSFERSWLGTFHRVAIYNRALDPDEVTTHFDLGQEQLNFDVPEVTIPDEPWEDLGPTGAGGGFLWKPVSESDGNLVILFPSSYTGEATGCHVVNAAGELVETGNYVGDGNGNRQHYRFGQPGSAYGSDLYVIANTPTGNIHWHVSNGATRTEY